MARDKGKNINQAHERGGDGSQGAPRDAGAAADEGGRRPSPTLEAMKQQAAMAKRLRDRMDLIRHKVMVLSGKGGVGKSTVTASLGWELARREFRVGLLDADIHGPNLPLLMGVEGAELSAEENAILPMDVLPNLRLMSIGFLTGGTDNPVIWRGPMKAQVIKQFLSDVEWGPLDWLIVDNPPGTGDEPLTVAQELPDADGVVIVTLPQEVSLQDCRRAISFARKLNLRILGVIENMSGFVCPHCGERVDIFGSGSGKRMAAETGVPFLGAIPMAVEVPEMTDAGAPLVGPKAPAAVREALQKITDQLMINIAG